MLKLVLVLLLLLHVLVAQEGEANAAVVEIDGAITGEAKEDSQLLVTKEAEVASNDSNSEVEAVRKQLKQLEAQLEFAKISYDALKSECEREKGILVQSNDERVQALQSQVQGDSDARKSEFEREKSLLQAEIESTLQLNKELQSAKQSADRDVKALQFCSSAKEAAEKESGSMHISLTELRAEAAECSAKLKEAGNTILEINSSNKVWTYGILWWV